MKNIGIIREIDNIKVNENTIWNMRENNPELVVRDCIKIFGFTEEQADILRYVLMVRGVNKWLLARRKFIKLKHKVKEMLNNERKKGRFNMNVDRFKVLQFINTEMRHIARMPRWVQWGKSVSRNWKNVEKNIVIRGKHC